METLLPQFSWLYVVAAVAAGFFSFGFYRVFLHPLSSFPGPKLAALTRLYEAYYDLYQNGKYTFRIAEMHRRYGPIVRISPHELHISDAAFFDYLYRQDSQYNKHAWAVNGFGVPGAALCTVDHKVHRARRQPQSPFFAKSKVASQQGVIHYHMNRLFDRLAAFVETGDTFDFGAAITAFIRDVTNDYMLGKSYNSLGRDDFDVAQVIVTQGSGGMWRLGKFMPFLGPMVQAIPSPWLVKLTNGPFREFALYLQETEEDTRKLVAAATSGGQAYSDKRTLVHDIVESKLPASEKSWQRVFQDIQVATGAGFETTASVARLICFHLFTTEDILRRLRQELTSAGATAEEPLDVKTLQQLTYLGAIIHEGLRLNPGVATRMARVDPVEDIVYEDWRIPAGTPVGMTILLMHMDEKLYPDPDRFDPDRWIAADNTLKRNTEGFAPFSKGPRICLGMNLAWAELYIFVASLAQRYDFTFPLAVEQDFRCETDNFAIGTRGQGRLEAVVSRHRASEA